MVAVDQLVNISEWDYQIIILLLIVIICVSAISYFTTIYLGERISGFLSRINYSGLCATVLAGLAIMIFMFTGWFGFIIFLISMPAGMIASYAKVRKINAMGVIMLPVILYFL